MSDILDRIVHDKRLRLQDQSRMMPLNALKNFAKQLSMHGSGSFLAGIDAVYRSGRPALIAEIKRRSPSKGDILPNLNPADIALQYARSGAAAISVLTEEDHFSGSIDDLSAVRDAVPSVPILRKDFVIDEYQLWEAKVIGANAVLLILSVLNDEKLIEFHSLARSLGMDVLFEVHDQAELERLLCCTQPSLIGVNNRNLRDFSVSTQVSLDLINIGKKSTDALWISESGIESSTQVARLQGAGFAGFLVGETLMRSGDIPVKIRELFSY